MAAVILSTTTTIHTPAKNLHDTKDLQGKFFFLHLGHSHYMFGDYYYELSDMAKPHFFIWELTGLV